MPLTDQYVADTANCTIRKIASDGVVSTLAGLANFDQPGNPKGDSVDGQGVAARFNFPAGISVDMEDNVFVADTLNHTIRKITAAGTVTTFAGLSGSAGSDDGTGKSARFDHPHGLAMDSTGNLYVADSGNSIIRKITPTGTATTLSGSFLFPASVAVDSAGNLYVADSGSHTISKITMAGVVTTLAGLAGNSGSADGVGATARFNYPGGIAVDNLGTVYVSDTNNETVRKITPAGVVTTLAGLANAIGDDGSGVAARFAGAIGIAVDNAGNIYVADSGNSAIRKGSRTPPLILNSGPGFGFNKTRGQFGFALMGAAAQSVVIETSTNLITWKAIWTNNFAGAFNYNFVDPQSGVFSPRFYRAYSP